LLAVVDPTRVEEDHAVTPDGARGEIQGLLLRYLTANALDGRRPETGVRPDTRYLDIGILNSLGLIMFIEFTEDRFGVRFSAADLQSYEFQTPAGLAEIIERLGGSAADG
jgi:acyl carrier protein